MFLERQANKEKAGVKEAHKANQQNHPFYSGGKLMLKLKSEKYAHLKKLFPRDFNPRPPIAVDLIHNCILLKFIMYVCV